MDAVIYSFIDKYLDHFHFLVMVNNAALVVGI